jgi:hypothetical protein
MDTKQLVKYFLDKNGGEKHINAEDIYWLNNNVFGQFAITENGQMYLEGLAHNDDISFGFICKIMALTVQDYRNGVRAVWACKGDRLPEIKRASIHYLEDYIDYQIKHSEKPQKILECLASKANNFPFSPIPFTETDCLLCEMPIFDEVYPWLGQLAGDGLIIAGEEKTNPRIQNSILTPKGWKEIEQKRQGMNSKKAFIAMSFGIQGRSAIQNAIQEGCRAVDFEAKSVDGEEFNGKITDKILALIKESAFVIAEFSENNKGVYFEAGYAEGLGKTVIYCISKDHLKDLHFDTAQTNYIVWDTVDQLKERIIDRIKATIL